MAAGVPYSRKHRLKMTYDGNFVLDWLLSGETVRSAGDGSGTVDVLGEWGSCRIKVGDDALALLSAARFERGNKQ